MKGGIPPSSSVRTIRTHDQWKAARDAGGKGGYAANNDIV